MNNNLLAAINKLIAGHGKGILADTKRVNALLSDLASREPKPQRMAFIKCLMYGFHTELQKTNAADRYRDKNRLAQRLHDEEGMDAALANDTVDLLEAVLFGSVSNPPKPAPQPAPQVIPQPAPSPVTPPSIPKETQPGNPPQYCRQCGAQIPDNSKFCLQCGANVAGGTEAVNQNKVDTNKVLKQGDFLCWFQKSMWGLYEKGILTLYEDRLEWQGKNNFNLPIKNIIVVKHAVHMGTPYLEIGDGSTETSKFTIFRLKAGDFFIVALEGMNNKNTTQVLTAQRNTLELESWRQAIDQLRGRL